MSDYPLPRDKMLAMCRDVETSVAAEGCDGTGRFTKLWTSRLDASDAVAVLQWLHDHGDACDCMVVEDLYPY